MPKILEASHHKSKDPPVEEAKTAVLRGETPTQTTPTHIWVQVPTRHAHASDPRVSRERIKALPSKDPNSRVYRQQTPYVGAAREKKPTALHPDRQKCLPLNLHPPITMHPHLNRLLLAIAPTRHTSTTTLTAWVPLRANIDNPEPQQQSLTLIQLNYYWIGLAPSVPAYGPIPLSRVAVHSTQSKAPVLHPASAAAHAHRK